MTLLVLPPSTPAGGVIGASAAGIGIAGGFGVSHAGSGGAMVTFSAHHLRAATSEATVTVDRRHAASDAARNIAMATNKK